MPIDPAALERHVKAQIAHYPVTVRWNRVAVFQASWQVSRALLNAIDGGVVNFGGGTLIAAKSDFGARTPGAEDKIEVLQADGTTYVTYSMLSVEGTENPLAREYSIVVESPEAE